MKLQSLYTLIVILAFAYWFLVIFNYDFTTTLVADFD